MMCIPVDGCGTQATRASQLSHPSTCLRVLLGFIAALIITTTARGATSTSFINNVQFGGTRNDITGQAGISVTIGSEDVAVTHLARFVLPGNTGSHTVRIVRASDSSEVPGASVTIDTASSVPAEFAYVELPEPVTLLAFTRYYIVSSETQHGDHWYDVNTILTTTGIATVDHAVFQTAGAAWSAWGALNNAYGPVDFKFRTASTPAGSLTVAISSIQGGIHTEPASLTLEVAADIAASRVELFRAGVLIGQDNQRPFSFSVSNLFAGIYQFRARAIGPGNLEGLSEPVRITIAPGFHPAAASFVSNITPGTTRNDFNGELGMRFTIGPKPVTLTALGRLFSPGNDGLHRLRLVRALDQIEVANGATLVSMAGGTPGQFKYGPLPGPITLTPGNSYYLLSEEHTGGDHWADFNSELTVMDIATLDSPVFVGGNVTWTELPAPGRTLVGLDFKYIGDGEAPPSISIQSPLNASTLVEPPSLDITVATDPDVVRVRFLSNNTLLGERTNSPFTFNWTSPTIGTHSLTTIATDAGNMSSTSAPVSIVIAPFQPPPTIHITQPGNGTSITQPDHVNLEVDVTGNVATVEYFANTTKIAESISAPFSALWIPLPGTYAITAVATGTLGQASTSAPVNITVMSDLGGGGGPHFIIDVQPGNTRRDFAGFIGMIMTTGPEPIDVSYLGRLFIPGNNGSHRIKIVRASTGIDVPGSQISVSMGGGVAGTFRYAPLPAPITLEPNTRYYIVSEEFPSGDAWHDLTTQVTSTSVGTVQGSVYYLNGIWNESAALNFSYGPVDFRYGTNSPMPAPAVTITAPLNGATITEPEIVDITAQVSAGITNVEFFANGLSLGHATWAPWSVAWHQPPAGSHLLTAVATDANGVTSTSATVTVTLKSLSDDGALVRSVSGGSPRNNFNNFVGMRFTTGQDPLEITGLGRYFLPGNQQSHELKLIRVIDGIDVPGGSATVDMTRGAPGMFVYTALSNAITLPPHSSFYLVSREYADGDHWLDINSAVTFNNIVTVNGGIYAWTTPFWQEIPGQGVFVPLSFRFTSDESAAPMIDITIPMPGSTFSGPSSVQIGAIASESVLHVEFFAGETPIGLSTTRPFAVSWPHPAPGDYSLTARATDVHGQSATSDPVQITIQPGLPPGVEEPFITGTVTGTLRNDFGGYLGMVFTTGPESVMITKLGRWHAAGNSHTHHLKLVRHSDGTDVPGGSATVNMLGGTPGNFSYAGLPEPVVLAPGTTYYLVSEEQTGGDSWHDVAGTTATHSSVATLDSGIFGGPVWIGGGLVNQTYIPVNFIYRAREGSAVPLSVSLSNPSDGQHFSSQAAVTFHAQTTPGTTRVEFFANDVKLGESTSSPFSFTWFTPPAGNHALSARATSTAGTQAGSEIIQITVEPTAVVNEHAFITGFIPGDTRNNVSGFVGMEFTIGPDPITITQLGRMMLNGNNGVHTLKLVTEQSGIDIPNSSVTVSMAGGTPGEFVYAQLPNPIILQAHTGYYVVSEEVSGGDAWHDLNRTIVTSEPIAVVDGGVFAIGQWVSGGLLNHSYGPVNFKFGSIGAPQPPTVTIINPIHESTVPTPVITIDTSTGPEVSKVEFFNGILKLGEDLTAPFSFSWNNNLPGNYQIFTRSTSTSGATAVSDLVSFNLVTPPPDPNIIIKLLQVRWSEGQVVLILTGLPGAQYQIEKTSDFITWTPLATYTATNSEIVADSITPAGEPGFYRAVLLE